MIDYETYCRIRHLHREKGLEAPQIATMLTLNVRTVERWLSEKIYRQRNAQRKTSKLESFKPQIVRWLERYPYTGEQLLRMLREVGYEGGITILREHLARIRPRRAKAYLTLTFAPGECAQVDWGQFGSVPVGSTTRRLSFFVMVLCHSRMMYVEFTVSETMEHWLSAHQNAFNFFGAVPESIMVDNLKSAVLKRNVGEAPVYNRRYLDLAAHFGFEIKACGVGKGNEKGRVENAVGYVKKNFLGGLDIPDFSAVNPAARVWLDEVANVRVHGATRRQPADMLAEDLSAMHPLALMPYDVSVPRPVRANNRFRVTLDTNRYSVPAEYAGKNLTLKAFPERIAIYHATGLIARHPRSYDRNCDFEDSEHPKELLAQRRAAAQQQILKRFLTLTPKAQSFYTQLKECRVHPLRHIRRIVALSDQYGTEKLVRAMDDAIHFHAFSSEYIANILEQREHTPPEPGTLHLTRNSDLLDLDLPEPDLTLYDPSPEYETGEAQ